MGSLKNLSLHKQKIVSLLKKKWVTQMDVAQASISLNLSKRLCELEYELPKDWKIERRWKPTGTVRCKQYTIVKA